MRNAYFDKFQAIILIKNLRISKCRNTFYKLQFFYLGYNAFVVKELKRFDKDLNGNPIYSKNIVNVQLDLEKKRLVSKILLPLKCRLSFEIY